MTTFDFITTPEFRASLESDLAEMQRSLASQSWKATQILAGSIVEALLVDYLSTLERASIGGKDPLKLELAEAITICTSQGIILQRTADLCSVIRSYRNLIHPGRLVRLNETPPTEESANIAASVVKLIIQDVAIARKGKFGFTAEQITAKLENDHNSTVLLPHFLKDVHESELERLLMGVLADKYFSLLPLLDSPFEEVRESCARLTQGFRIALRSSNRALKQKVASRFIHFLRTDTGTHVDQYAEAFFRCHDIELLSEKDRPVVVDFYLSKLPSVHDSTTSVDFGPLVSFLAGDQVIRWLDPYVRALLSASISDDQKSSIRLSLLEAQTFVNPAAGDLIDKRLDGWIKHLKANQPDNSSMLQGLKTELASERLPF